MKPGDAIKARCWEMAEEYGLEFSRFNYNDGLGFNRGNEIVASFSLVESGGFDDTYYEIWRLESGEWPPRIEKGQAND